MTQNQPQSPALTALLADIVKPEGFVVNEHGTFAVVPTKNGSELKELTDVPLGITARARNPIGNRWFVRIEWLSPEGGRDHLQVQAHQLLSNFGPIVEEFAKRGVVVNHRTQTNLKDYFHACQKDKAIPVGRAVEHLGFATELGDDFPLFVLPNQVIVPPSGAQTVERGERVFFSPSSEVPSLAGYRTSGSLQGWQDALAPWGDHALIVFGAVLGFVGAFKHLIGAENHGFHLWGGTSTGKSTSSQVCVSVMGNPVNPGRTPDGAALFQTWNATPAGVELILAPHSGMTVVIDEIGAKDGALNFYNAFSGIARVRMNELGNQRDQSRWSVVVMSTGEYSARAHTETHTPAVVTDGMSVRMLDISASAMLDMAAQAGAPTFTESPEGKQGIERLQREVTHNYGWALPALVEFVNTRCSELGMTPADGLKGAVAEHEAAMVERAIEGGAKLTSAQLRGLQRLALASAVGAIAVQSGVLPFTEDQVMRAIDAAQDAWLGDVQFLTESEKIGENLRNYVTAYFHHFRPEDKRLNLSSTERPFFFLADRKLIFFSDEQLKRAAGTTSIRIINSFLRANGWLNGGEKGHATAKLTKEVAQALRADAPEGAKIKGRGYYLLAEKVLGTETLAVLMGVTSSAQRDDSERSLRDEETPAFDDVDEEGVIRGYELDVYDYHPLGGPMTEEELIASMPPDDRPYEGEPPLNRATVEMPKRRKREVGGGDNHGSLSVPEVPALVLEARRVEEEQG